MLCAMPSAIEYDPGVQVRKLIVLRPDAQEFVPGAFAEFDAGFGDTEEDTEERTHADSAEEPPEEPLSRRRE